MWNEYSVLGVVPARGGSKGIPGKNLSRIAGRTLIAWTAAVIDQLPWIDASVLSTDDGAIAEEGRRSGLAVPFLRPAPLASDTATGVDTWRHAWLAAEEAFERRFDLSVYLQPTTPLRSSDQVTRTLVTLIEGGHRAATTIAPVPGHFVPEKILTLDPRGVLSTYLEAGASVSNRQSAPSYYYRTGACYAAWRDTIVVRGQIIEEDCAGVLVEGPTVNIDDPLDLTYARFLAENALDPSPD